MKQEYVVSSIFCTFNCDLCHFIAVAAPHFSFFPLLVLQSECWKKENDRQSAEEDSSGEIFGFDVVVSSPA